MIISQISRNNSINHWMILTMTIIILWWIRLWMWREKGWVLWIYLELQWRRRRKTQIVVSCQGRLKIVAQSDDLILILQKYMHFILQMYDWFFKKHSTKNRLFLYPSLFHIILVSNHPKSKFFPENIAFWQQIDVGFSRKANMELFLFKFSLLNSFIFKNHFFPKTTSNLL